jgi:hypothetical protein
VPTSPLSLALWLISSSLGAPPPPVDAGSPVPTLSVRELTEPVPRGGGLAPTGRARALDGSRVRLLGYMARQEEPSPGGFWLTSRPVECDEGGGGTADLPPGSVRVLLPGEAPAPIDGPIAVTGTLEVGNRGGEGGPPSAVRLRVDPSPPAPPPPSSSRP